ncbi:MAG: hypothetical protein PHF35_01475 [Candidatus Moranbacteria bacterium]|nr:hypothetical protein [Candidatus Moranbacteria bacterium]
MEKNIRYRLASTETSQKIQAIGRKYGFELERLANITRLIREYYFGEVRFEDFPKEIESRMGVSLLTAQEITRYIQHEIIDWDPWGEYLASLPKLTAREIVERRPKLAGLEITGGYIESQNSDELEDPTIKNWIHDYVSRLGYARHTQMQRTEYLFRSANGVNLDSPDREKLSIIIRSFDENIPLPVDEENGEIIFDSEQRAGNKDQRSKINDQSVAQVPFREERGVSQIPAKPVFKPQPQPAKPAFIPKPQPAPQKETAFVRSYSPPAPPPTPQVPSPAPANFVTDLHPDFSAKSDEPPVRIKSITSRNGFRPSQPDNRNRPKHIIYDPISDDGLPEPKLEGNVVDLRGE